MKTRKKKPLAVTALVLAVVIILGGTYAWFTSRVELPAYEAAMGRLIVETEYEEFDKPIGIEPLPDDIEPTKISGTINNSGSIDATIKLDFRGKILIKSDAAGNPLPEDEWYYIQDASSLAMAGAQIDESSLVATNADAPFITIKDTQNPGVYYLMAPSHANAGGAYSVDISLYVKPSNTMDNIFQGSQLQFDSEDWLATQSFDEAINDAFGIDLWEGLMDGDYEIMIDNDGMAGPFSFDGSLRGQLMARVQEMLGV